MGPHGPVLVPISAARTSPNYNMMPAEVHRPDGARTNEVNESITRNQLLERLRTRAHERMSVSASASSPIPKKPREPKTQSFAKLVRNHGRMLLLGTSFGDRPAASLMMSRSKSWHDETRSDRPDDKQVKWTAKLLRRDWLAE